MDTQPDRQFSLDSHSLIRRTTFGKTKSSKRSLPPRRIATIIIAVSLIFVGSWLLYLRFFNKPNLDNVNVVMHEVSRHYSLPTNEIPALATVTDSNKVQSSFSGKVQNGDKILIYQVNKKAIVYRPSIDRIVDVEPVLIDTPPSATKQTN